MKNSRFLNYIPAITITISAILLAITISEILLAISANIIYEESLTELVCTREEVVKSIVQIRYRSAEIELETGERVWVDQATLSPGSVYCLKQERRRK